MAPQAPEDFTANNNVPNRSTLQKGDGTAWLQSKTIHDNVGQYWRVHDDLYDLTDYINRHPGGEQWLSMSKGIDITEAFEAHHPDIDKVKAILKKYHVRPADTPRLSPLTFAKDGFYATVRRRILPVLKAQGDQPPNKSKQILDNFVITFIALMLASAYFNSYILAILAGFVLSLLTNTAHNFFHQRDNWRMFAFDLSLFTSYDWRVSHAFSHHIFPNTSWDIELSSLEPMLIFFPGVERNLINANAWIYMQFFFCFTTPLTLLTRIVGILIGKTKFRFRNLIPLIELVAMIVVNGSFWNALWLFGIMHVAMSWSFSNIGLTTGHHADSTWKQGDFPPPKDFGMFQMEATADRREVLGTLIGVLVSYGDHTLHHLFPTIDHAYLPALYPEFKRTCDEFGLDFEFTTYPEMMMGMYRSLNRTQPNPNPRRTKKHINLKKTN